MKNILLLMGLLYLPLTNIFAQTKSVQSFYERYADEEKATDVTIKGWLLELANQFADDVESKKVLSKITQLRVLLMEDGNPVSSHEYGQLKKDLSKDKFEELLLIRDADSQIDFYIKEEKNIITDVLMLVNESDGFILLSLEGLLNMEDLKNININTEGGEHFKKIKKDVPRA